MNDYDGIVELKYTIKKINQKISASNISKKANAASFYLNAKLLEGDGKLLYKSGNSSIASIDSKGKITIKKAGTVKITISATGTRNCYQTQKTITLKIVKAAQSITGVASSYSVKKTSKTLQLRAKANGTIRYYIVSGSKYASIDSRTGKLVFKAKGTVKVQIKAGATSKYNSASKTITVTIK